MLADLSIIPVGGDPHTSELLAEIVRAIEASGIRFQLTPTTTCLEGTWEEISTVAQRCHGLARESSPHVVTLLRIEDDADSQDKLARNTASVEERAGRRFPVTPEEATSAPRQAR